FFFFQAEDGIRDKLVTGVQTCALPIFSPDEYGRSPYAACRLARHRRRLVLGPAIIQECLLGQGHDVDLPPERHLHLQLFSAVLRSEERRVGKECRSRLWREE